MNTLLFIFAACGLGALLRDSTYHAVHLILDRRKAHTKSCRSLGHDFQNELF